jgi:hypothetical protein
MSKQVFDGKRQGELIAMDKKCIENKKLFDIQVYRGLDKDK